MEILRNLFGSLFAGIIRLLVTVGILAAAYFFLLKPVLETTDRAIDSANETFQGSFGPVGELGDVGAAIESVNRRVQREVRRALRDSERGGRQRQLVRCIRRADGNAQRIRRCVRRH